MIRSRPLDSSSVRLALLAAGALASACSGVSGDPPGGTDCAAACENMARTECGQPDDGCAYRCRQTREALQAQSAECQQAFDDHVACLATIQEPGCAAGSIDQSPCRRSVDRYRNRCSYGVSADEPCTELPERYREVCGGDKPLLCRGEAPANCEPGGGAAYPDLYCCPDPSGETPDGGTPIDTPSPMLRACLFLRGCGAYGTRLPLVSTFNCVEALWNARLESAVSPLVPAARAISCGSSASDCASFAACMTLGHGEAWCAAHPGPSCDGNVLVTCGDPSTMQAVDCTLGGNHCQGADGQAQCLTREGCAQSGSYCTGETSWAYCQSSGAETGYGCQIGERCWDVPGAGAAQCISSTSCSSPGTSRCDGTVTRTCQSLDGVSSVEQSYDCGSWGAGVCKEAGGQAWCEQPQAECAGDQCDGNRVEACVFGKTLSLDCKQLGFSSCASGNGTAGCL